MPPTQNKHLIIDAEKDFSVLKASASPVRISILKLLADQGPLNVNEISASLDLPQSSVSSNIQSLEQAGLVRTESHKARKGSQKVCFAVYDELIVTFHKNTRVLDSNIIEVSMPLGLYSNCSVTSPCGLCSVDGIIGFLDVPDTFLDPARMKAALLWFTSGYVEYQFPNNARLKGREVEHLECSMEISSEVPGTHADWPSDITMYINDIEVGSWVSPGDFGDKRGAYTPDWWKLKGSQYGLLKSWQVSSKGTFVDGQRVSDVTLDQLELPAHQSIRIKLEVKASGTHPGGLNIFGRGFGNYDQDLLLRLHTKSG